MIDRSTIASRRAGCMSILGSSPYCTWHQKSNGRMMRGTSVRRWFFCSGTAKEAWPRVYRVLGLARRKGQSPLWIHDIRNLWHRRLLLPNHGCQDHGWCVEDSRHGSHRGRSWPRGADPSKALGTVAGSWRRDGLPQTNGDHEMPHVGGIC